MASQVELILAAVKIACEQAGLGNIAVVQRQLPKVYEGDTLPIILVCETRSAGRKPLTFEGHRKAKYRVQTTLIDSGSADLTSKTALYAQWRENLREKLFGTDDVLSGVAAVWQVEIEDDDTFDQGALSNLGYAYWPLNMWYGVIE